MITIHATLQCSFISTGVRRESHKLKSDASAIEISKQMYEAFNYRTCADHPDWQNIIYIKSMERAPEQILKEFCCNAFEARIDNMIRLSYPGAQIMPGKVAFSPNKTNVNH